jgi:hypothetical protein
MDRCRSTMADPALKQTVDSISTLRPPGIPVW